MMEINEDYEGNIIENDLGSHSEAISHKNYSSKRNFWLSAMFPLCSYGFFRSLKFSEAFLTVFLAEYKHLTLLEVNF
jgi:hypothetical protein